jgi:hypothetical protein
LKDKPSGLLLRMVKLKLYTPDFSKEGGVRKKVFIILFLNLVFLPAFCSGQTFGLKPLSNNITLYQNSYDDWKGAGQTLQIVMINSFKLGTWFTLEITGDIDQSLQEKGKTCHYFELGLVKDVVPRFGLNYQRIIGTFVDKPVNQFGIRFSF